MITQTKNALSQLDGKTVYLSGAITGDSMFAAKFADWEARAIEAGATRVLNPATLPAGWTYGEYMEHCLLMVRRADAVLMLPCWRGSLGAKAELAYAQSLKLMVVDLCTAVGALEEQKV